LLGVGNNGGIFRKSSQTHIPHGSDDSLDPRGVCREPFVAHRVVQICERYMMLGWDTRAMVVATTHEVL
jgi:hypothetical protein